MVSLLVFIAVQRDDINALNPMKVNRLAAHIRVFFSESVQGRVQRRPRPRQRLPAKGQQRVPGQIVAVRFQMLQELFFRQSWELFGRIMRLFH